MWGVAIAQNESGLPLIVYTFKAALHLPYNTINLLSSADSYFLVLPFQGNYPIRS
jgi:hypothetical protein